MNNRGVANNFSKRKFREHWIEKETCIYFHVDHQGNKQTKIKSSMQWIGSIQFNWTLTKEKQNAYAFGATQEATTRRKF